MMNACISMQNLGGSWHAPQEFFLQLEALTLLLRPFLAKMSKTNDSLLGYLIVSLIVCTIKGGLAWPLHQYFRWAIAPAAPVVPLPLLNVNSPYTPTQAGYLKVA